MDKIKVRMALNAADSLAREIRSMSRDDYECSGQDTVSAALDQILKAIAALHPEVFT